MKPTTTPKTFGTNTKQNKTGESHERNRSMSPARPAFARSTSTSKSKKSRCRTSTDPKASASDWVGDSMMMPRRSTGSVSSTSHPQDRGPQPAAHVEHQKRTGRPHLFYRSSQDESWPAWYGATWWRTRPGVICRRKGFRPNPQLSLVRRPGRAAHARPGFNGNPG